MKQDRVWVRWVAAMAVGAAFTAQADTVVGAGATLSVTNTEDLGFSAVQLNAGATLAFLGNSIGTAGLNEYTRTGSIIVGTPGVTAYGTWTRFTTNAAYASEVTSAQNTEYVYTGRWHIPADGSYSFYEDIDDGVGLYVDNVSLLNDNTWNTETRKQGVVLAQGWHDLEIRIRNGSATGGPFLANLKSGLLFSPVNDVIATNNQANAYPFADPGDASVLKPVRNALVFQKIWVSTNAVFDLADQALVAPLQLTGGLYPLPGTTNARLTVIGGSGEIVLGSTGGAINSAPFNTDVAFSNVTSVVGITFRDYATVVAWPTSCPWRVAANATVALTGTTPLGTGDVALTNFNVFVLSRNVFSEQARIRVQGTNLTVSIKPCSIDSYGSWSGVPATVTNDISLEGVNAAAVFPDNADFYLQGFITGTGTVAKTGNARTEILEPSDFVGNVTCVDLGTLIFDAATAGNSNNAVTVGATATLALYPAGYGTSDTTAWIKTLHGSGTGGKVFIPARQTLTVDTLDGAVSVQGSGSTSVLHVRNLATNATLNVLANTAVVLDSIGSGSSVVLTNETATLTVAGSGQTLDSLTLTSGRVAVSGTFTVANLSGAGTLLKNDAGALTVNFSVLAGGLVANAGAVKLSNSSTGDVLSTLPALWLDASASNVFTQYKSYTFTNGFKIVERWNDRRSGAPGYAYQSRGEDQWQTYPYVATNAQNGLSVLSFGAYQGTLPPSYESRTEARRMYLYTNVAPRYVAMVFGSQNGGGAAVLGATDTSSFFKRGGSTAADYQKASTPILSALYPVWTNGISVVSTNTGFNGGYQILTIKTQGQTASALGWINVYTTAGGQNYGEALFYTNDLTTVQRMSVEAYLAKKWNLPYGAIAIPSISVASGATVTIDGNYTVGTLTGNGNVVCTNGAAITLNGVFTGTLTLSGGTLAVPDLKPIPAAEGLSTDRLAVWFDPCQTNRVVLGGAYTPSRPLAVAALFDCTTTNRYLLGTCAPDVSVAVDRRPWLSATNTLFGETQYWLDFSNTYSNDARGNTLRLNRNTSNIGTQFTDQTPTNVQSGFIVLDSATGGGVPITLDVGATQAVTRDNPQSYASPIWGSNTTSSLKSGQTFLNGVSVNGASQGFSGSAELLSFVATNVFQAAYFGFYGGDNIATPNRERLGEIILYDASLTADTRAGIEAYLMKKWLSKLRAGYGTSSSVTLSGFGAVSAVSPAQLPAFDPSFSGAVALSGTSFDFTLTTNGVGACVVSPATALPGGLTVAATGTVSVFFTVKPPAGTYTLMTYGSVAGGGFANWGLITTGKMPAGAVLLKKTSTALNLVVTAPGTMIRIL